jgi:hypothetical protein
LQVVGLLAQQATFIMHAQLRPQAHQVATRLMGLLRLTGHCFRTPCLVLWVAGFESWVAGRLRFRLWFAFWSFRLKAFVPCAVC